MQKIQSQIYTKTRYLINLKHIPMKRQCTKDKLHSLFSRNSISYIIMQGITIRILFFADDLSEKKKAFQSHTHPGDNFNAMNAVDGVVETCTRTLEIGFNSRFKTLWWKVDLGAVYNIYSINIQFKNYEDYGKYICTFCLFKHVNKHQCFSDILY